jgi:hypothetical protein
VGAGAAAGNESVIYAPTIAGALAGQAVHIANNFDNVASQTLAVTGAAYDFASPAISPATVSFTHGRSPPKKVSQSGPAEGDCTLPNVAGTKIVPFFIMLRRVRRGYAPNPTIRLW